MSETVLDRIVDSVLAALTFNANVHVPPVALLWPDEGAQWGPVIKDVRATLGP